MIFSLPIASFVHSSNVVVYKFSSAHPLSYFTRDLNFSEFMRVETVKIVLREPRNARNATLQWNNFIQTLEYCQIFINTIFVFERGYECVFLIVLNVPEWKKLASSDVPRVGTFLHTETENKAPLILPVR